MADIILTESSEQLLIESQQALSTEFNVANEVKAWRGAVEPAETSSSGNEIKLWRGAVEPTAVIANQSSLGITLSANGDLGVKKEIGGVQGFRDSMSSTYQAPKADFVRYPKRKR